MPFRTLLDDYTLLVLAVTLVVYTLVIMVTRYFATRVGDSIAVVGEMDTAYEMEMLPQCAVIVVFHGCAPHSNYHCHIVGKADFSGRFGVS